MLVSGCKASLWHDLPAQDVHPASYMGGHARPVHNTAPACEGLLVAHPLQGMSALTELTPFLCS